MSFLFPLYIAGLAALSLPIAFHLIRRAPRGRQAFSSLMFLTPSPPRVTRRSRLDHILLLLLRAGVLVLLALAFARPFWRQSDATVVANPPGRRIVLLLDTSASMRRDDLWNQAIKRLEATIAAAEPGDQFALLTFDQHAARVFTFEEWNSAGEAFHRKLVEDRLVSLAPSWRAADLSGGLAAAAETLQDTSGDPKQVSASPGQVVLISDLAAGDAASSLAAFTWPHDVKLRVEAVTPRSPNNAGLQVLLDANLDDKATNNEVRVRVVNAADSQRETFVLAWASADGDSSQSAASVHVPPGETRVVRLKRRAVHSAADRIVLSGDDHDFDNTNFIAPPRPELIQVTFYGVDDPDDPRGLLYYLRAALDGPTCSVGPATLATAADETIAPDSGGIPLPGATTRLVVGAGVLAEDEADLLKRHVQAGGVGLFVVRGQDDQQTLSRLIGEGASLSEADVNGYAMLGEVDFGHPLLAPLAGPKFADFTRVHFWKYRRLALAQRDAALCRPLLEFESGDPALLEATVGAGRLFVLTSGWDPADSQLALSSKFVPLLRGILGLAGGTPPATHFEAGDADCPDPGAAPGIYVLAAAEGGIEGGDDESSPSDGEIAAAYAVNLPASESLTTPLTQEDLERHGVQLGVVPSQAEQIEAHRQLRERELEQQQQFWKWLIVGALGLVVAETIVSKRLTVRSAAL